MSENNGHVAVWLVIVEYYARIVTDDVILMYSKQTNSTGISVEDLKNAFDSWCLNSEKCQRFPLPGDLVAIVKGTGSSRSAADQIANDVLTAMNSYSSHGFRCPIKLRYTQFGPYVHVEFGVMALRTIEKWGGAHSLRLEINECRQLSTVRAQLRDLAQSLIDAPNASQQEPRSIQLTGSETAQFKTGKGQVVSQIVNCLSKDTDS